MNWQKSKCWRRVFDAKWQWILTCYNEGETAKSICAMLNEQGIGISYSRFCELLRAQLTRRQAPLFSNTRAMPTTAATPFGTASPPPNDGGYVFGEVNPNITLRDLV